MVEQADFAELTRRIGALESRVTAASESQCTAERPHPNRLVFVRRGPGRGEYMCECGMVYEKDGNGGLRDI